MAQSTTQTHLMELSQYRFINLFKKLFKSDERVCAHNRLVLCWPNEWTHITIKW